MTIVLDTNCLIQILPKQAGHRWLYDALLQGKITLAVSNEIVSEYEETIDGFYESKSLGENVARTLLELPKTRRIVTYYNWRLIIRDPDDDKYVDCAIAANADYIITHDGHFKVLKNVPFPKVVCLMLEQFRKIFEK
ncbi:MAG: putative toxin-antitoxin system toxin component, PIN family [Saprospiraceae bacterium]|nr:MAG: putative toxin-antitoxin system toxin component, PIN family [Saprospiraceae bacterium]